MYPVQGGTQKVTFNKPDPREYEAQKRAAMAQHGAVNPAVSGIQAVMDKGVGTAIKEDRTVYGNSNIMPNELMQGADSNFAQKDVPGNRPLEDTMNQTGNAEAGVSSTTQNRDVEDMEGSALERRMAMYQRAVGNADASLNDRGAY